MTEQSQLPLVGPLKRRGWREIVWFRPLTSSTHTALVVTRRGRLTGILPASGPRTLSDYLAWPYDFREVDTRERLLMLEQRLESLDGACEFSVSLRLVYQVVRAERVALELEDVQAELAHAVVQSMRLSGRSFGIEQDKTFEENLQETLIHGEALAQRIQGLGLVLRRADVTVALDEQTRAHAEALRLAMRERPLHFQVAVESLEPNRSFDVHVGGAYRLTERRAHDGPSEPIEGAIQMAITRTLRRVGITFEPSDYSNAAKAMAETLRRDALLLSELSMVQAQLLRPTVQIQPDHSMVHVPRPNPLRVPDTRPNPAPRRLRQGLPRVNRPPALLGLNESEEPREAPPAAVRRALPPPEQLPVGGAVSRTLPLDELPGSNDTIEGAYTLWPLPETMPAMRALPTPRQSHDEQDERAPWADLITSAEASEQDTSWSGTLPPTSLSEPAEPLPWDSVTVSGADEQVWDDLAPDEPEPQWLTPAPTSLSEPIEPLPWDSVAAEPAPDEPELRWPAPAPTSLSEPVEPLPWDSVATEEVDQPLPSMPRADGDAAALTWAGPDAVFGTDTSMAAPNVSGNEPPDDPGYSLDWSEPESAAAVDALGDDLDLTPDWSERQAEPTASDSSSSLDTLANDDTITAHWDESVITPAESTFFSDAFVEGDAEGAVTANPRSAPGFDPDQSHQYFEDADVAALPTQAEQDEAQSSIDLEAPPWYTPTMHVNDRLPFDTFTDDAPPPMDTFGVTWAEPPQAPSAPIDGPIVDDPIAQLPAEALDTAPVELSAESSPLTDQQEIEDLNQPTSEDDEPAVAVSAELIARMIGMIQSYGPAWFKMWSLELKERPEQLPVVLGEVTADPVLLAQADDPHVQSALLLALAAYSAPAVDSGRLISPAPLPGPALAVPSNEDEDTVPDLLSLRVKWNGHGGGR